jgi:hypothetical protein
VQNGEGAELPAVAVRGHQVSVWRGLGEVRVAVGEGRHMQRVTLAPPMAARGPGLRAALRHAWAQQPRQ